MKATSIARVFAAAIAASSMVGVTVSRAYVDIELDSGRHVKGDSYSSQDDKLVVYRPSGTVEIDRATVRSIREVEGSSGDEVSPAPPPVGVAPSTAAASAVPPAASPAAKDPKAREHELSHKLVNIRLNRLAASQRGDEETMKKLDKEIHSLQAERISNYKKLDPSFEIEQPSSN